LAQEKWTGPKLAPGAETAKQLGVDRVLGLEQFQSEITDADGRPKEAVYRAAEPQGDAPPSTQEGHVSRLRGLFPFAEIAQAATPIAHLRMTKSARELALMKRAIQITLAAHGSACRAVADGRLEYEVEACSGV
jgi:Xaa-Pro aminopeptidase